jgi:cell shape-determining protein MreD
MRVAIALLSLGLVATVAQGGIATFLPPPYCPDFAFLVALAVGLLWEPLVGGMIVVAILGYGADLLSGSLFGQHALLRLLTFLVARAASRRVNIRGALPIAIFGFVATLVYGLALLLVTSFYSGAASMTWSWVSDLLRHAAVNGLLAPSILALTRGVIGLLDESDSSRRSLRLEPRGAP